VGASSRPDLVRAERPHFHVLLVEDHLALSDQLALALREEGWTVATASNGVEALEVLKSCDVELMVLDLMLPLMSGMELTDVVRSTPELSSLPIIMITAVGNVDRAPPGPVYLKPLRRDSFVHAVRLHLARRSH
jgi:CheY-like chemotaxis protein